MGEKKVTCVDVADEVETWMINYFNHINQIQKLANSKE